MLDSRLRGVHVHELQPVDDPLTDTRFVDCTFVGCKMLAVNWTVTGAGFDARPAAALRAVPPRRHDLRRAGPHRLHLRATACSPTSTSARPTCAAPSSAGSDLSGARFASSDLRDADLRGTRGLALDPRENRLKGTRLDLDATPGLLGPFGVAIT